jgi:uncharacterized protein (DUF1015 family)
MADVVPFPCVLPRKDMVREVAALPYDVYNLSEAKKEIERHPHSFLRIDMADTTLLDTTEPHDMAIYERARSLLDGAIEDGTYFSESNPYYYFYRLCSPAGRYQTGIVGCASIDDYLDGVIKKHENTRADKEIDRILHVDTCSAQTGPIFLAYRSDGAIEKIMLRVTQSEPLYDFCADDGVQHSVWRVDNAHDSAEIQKAFADVDSLYLADGHHRAAAAVKAGLLRRNEQKKNAQNQPLESDHFLAVIFPSDQLTILDYNRVVADLNGQSASEFLGRLKTTFTVSEPQTTPVKPTRRHTFGMYLGGLWYEIALKKEAPSGVVEACALPGASTSAKPAATHVHEQENPTSDLDVALLQDKILAPFLGIVDPRLDKRIDFVGGIRGLTELEQRVDSRTAAVAFALYPTSIEELFLVADAHMLMPPKSTWFDPKPRSGIFIHRI